MRDYARARPSGDVHPTRVNDVVASALALIEKLLGKGRRDAVEERLVRPAG